MNLSQVQALMPLLIWSLTAVMLMIQASIKRDQATAWVITAIGLVLTIWGAIYARDFSQTVTILFNVDPWGLFFSSLMALAALVTLLLSRESFADEGQRKEEYYLLLVLSLLGALVLIQSSHMVSLLLGMELMGVALYVMIAFPEKGELPVEAAIKYLVLSACASVILLYGFALLYAATGELSYAGLGVKAGQAYAQNPLLILAGTGMVISGIGFKLSLVPFHMWTPDVYQGAPTPVTGYLATVSKGAVFVALTRMYLDGQLYQYPSLISALAVIAIASMLIGNLLALRQNNIKRLLAYSSIAHLGYLLVVLIALTGKGLASDAVTYYLTAYVLTSLAAFAVIARVSGEDATQCQISAYEGLFWRDKVQAICLTVALLSLAGIPLTAGFIGKFYVITVGVQSSLWALLAAVVVGSAIAIYYYLRIIFAMSKVPEDTVEHQAYPGRVLALFLTLLVLVLGSWPESFINYATSL